MNRKRRLPQLLESEESVPTEELTPLRWEPSSRDEAILVILESPPKPGETLEGLFRRREHALGSLFATLDVYEARALHRRLSLSFPDDPVAMRFARLIAERRRRLLAFLAEAPRRTARVTRDSYERGSR